MPDVNINTGVQSINTETESLFNPHAVFIMFAFLGTMSEINELRHQLQDANSIKHVMHEECSALKVRRF